MIVLKFWVLECVCSLCGLLVSFLPKAKRNVAFVIPPDDRGSLGDEAMVIVLRRILEAKGYSVVFYGVSGDSGRYWGESVYAPNKISRFLLLLWHVIRSDVTVVVGADVVDGKYSDLYSYIRLRMAVLSVKAGMTGVVTPCSFNKTPSELVRLLAKKHAKFLRIFSRDDSSYENMCQAGLVPAKAADLAFGLHRLNFSRDDSKGLVAVFDSRLDPIFLSEEGELGVGLNINPLIPRVNKQFTEEKISLALSAFVADERVTFVRPIAHDVRPQSDDFGAVREFIQTLNGNVAKKIHSIATPKVAVEVEAAFERLDLVVAGRMHLAIAALGAGVPVVAFSYQDKFAGLQKLVGKDALVLIDSDEELASHSVLDIAAELLKAAKVGRRDYLESIGERILGFARSLPEARNAG